MDIFWKNIINSRGGICKVKELGWILDEERFELQVIVEGGGEKWGCGDTEFGVLYVNRLYSRGKNSDR